MNNLSPKLQLEVARGLVDLENKKGRSLTEDEVAAFMAGFNRCHGAWNNETHIQINGVFLADYAG